MRANSVYHAIPQSLTTDDTPERQRRALDLQVVSHRNPVCPGLGNAVRLHTPSSPVTAITRTGNRVASAGWM